MGAAAGPTRPERSAPGPGWSAPGGAGRWRHDPAAQRWALRLVVLLLVVGVGACVAVGADRPADARLLPNATRLGLTGHSSRTSRVPGFGHIGFRVVNARGPRDGGSLRCALLADNDAARAQGMKGRRDLAGYDAMIFRFPSDSTASFYNEGVPIALSIAWFDHAGVLVGSAALARCTAPCPTVAPSLPYRFGLEVPAGGLAHLGIGQGSVLLVGGSC